MKRRVWIVRKNVGTKKMKCREHSRKQTVSGMIFLSLSMEETLDDF